MTRKHRDLLRHEKLLVGAVSSGNLNEVQAIVERHNITKDQIDGIVYIISSGLPEITTSIMKIAVTKNLDLVEYLVNELDINIPNNSYDLLFRAASTGNLDILDFLVDKGCPINTPDHDLLSSIASLGNLQTVMHLIDNHGLQPNVSTLFAAVQSLNLELVEYLVDTTNINTNEQNQDGDTLLDIAIKNNSINIADYFLEKEVGFNLIILQEDNLSFQMKAILGDYILEHGLFSLSQESN